MKEEKTLNTRRREKLREWKNRLEQVNWTLATRTDLLSKYNMEKRKLIKELNLFSYKIKTYSGISSERILSIEVGAEQLVNKLNQESELDITSTVDISNELHYLLEKIRISRITVNMELSRYLRNLESEIIRFEKKKKMKDELLSENNQVMQDINEHKKADIQNEIKKLEEKINDYSSLTQEQLDHFESHLSYELERLESAIAGATEE